MEEGEQSILFVNLKRQIAQAGIRCVVSAEVTSADLISPLAFLTQVRACVRHRTALCLKIFEIPSPSVLSGNVIVSSVGRKKEHALSTQGNNLDVLSFIVPQKSAF